MTVPRPAFCPHRSVLYVPATNVRAMAKAVSLACDAIVYDLEDAVSPPMKERARRHLLESFPAMARQRRIVRVNDLSSIDFESDIALVSRLAPDAVLVPKVGTADQIRAIRSVAQRHRVPDSVALWIMVETVEALARLDELVDEGRCSPYRLESLVVGTNDIAKETGVSVSDDRTYLVPWLMSIVLAARRGHLLVLDGVWNDFKDEEGFRREAAQAVKMAFDGKTLIHPSQVGPTNDAFLPSAEAVQEAQKVCDLFGRPEHANAGVVNLDGRMVERLHLAAAERVLAIDEAARLGTSAFS